MSNKGGNILEKHSDKIILAVIGLLALFILAKTFVMSPHRVEINNDTYGPSSVDDAIQDRAKRLQSRIDEPAKKEKPDYPSNQQTEKFKSFLENSLRDFNDGDLALDLSISIPLPAPASEKAALAREYKVPELVELENPYVNVFRGVAYVPNEKVDLEHPYGSVNVRMEDIDLVTVQAEFDIKTLDENFYESFAGRSVKNKWKDESLAKPVFAKIQLQRKTVNKDGSESDWEDIGYAQINQYRELYNLPDKISEFNSSGLRTRYARLSAPEVRDQLLQPDAYDFAYPDYSWLAPEFDKERQKILERERELSRRMATPTMEREVDRRAPRPDRRQPERGMTERPTRESGDRRRDSQPRRTPERERPMPATEMGVDNTTEIRPEEKFEVIKISDDVKFDELDKLIVWAHDDTAKPGETYKYRMRVGIANPIAGLAGVSWSDDGQAEDSLIFWTNYVMPDGTVEIPKRMYIFATDIKRLVGKTMSFEVAKYNFGKWYKKEFIVRPGDSIGELAEVSTGGDGLAMDREQESKMIDFRTGSVMLDIVESTRWTGKSVLNPKQYQEVLYTDEDGSLVKVPARRSLWDTETVRLYNEIEDSLNTEVNLRDGFSPSRSSGSPSRDFSPEMDPML